MSMGVQLLVSSGDTGATQTSSCNVFFPSGRRLYRSIWTRLTLGTSTILARVRPASPRRAGVLFRREFFYGFYGTSASTPMLGGLLLQLIDRLEESGVCGGRDITLVQLNRFLYKAARTHSAAAIDTVHGNNAWDESTVNCSLGYEATEGWDPASGLGTVN